MFCKKVFLEVSQNSQENTCARVSFLIKLQAWGLQLYKKEAQVQVFSSELNFKNFMAPFYGWGSTASRLQPLRGGSLLFTIQFLEISGTHFIDLAS